ALCRTLRDDPEVGPSRPILLITNSRPTLSEHRSAMRCGVWEFLVEPLHAEEITGRVDAYVLATMDTAGASPAPLRDDTGLYTREGLARRAKELAVQAFHHHAGFACVMLAASEHDSRLVARRLQAAARRSDAVGRMGPSEFTILAPGTDARGARLLAQRLAKHIRAGDGTPPDVRVGFDAVANIRQASLEPRHMLDHARTALAKARSSARGEWIRAFE
ncbi:MAG TPA: diguanylate cyclase, partial [Gemmatimonadales bacterium]